MLRRFAAEENCDAEAPAHGGDGGPGGVKCPTLVCRGEESPILDDEIATRMVRALPDGQLYVFKETGHSLPRLQPERFAEMVRGFLLDEGLPAD